MSIAIALVSAFAMSAAACAGASEPLVEIQVDANGFPSDWPIRLPPGSLTGCSAGEILQDDALFSVVTCLPNEPDPFTTSQQYLTELEQDGFVEREPGQFLVEFETFLDGNGIELFYQLSSVTSPAQATIVLIRPAAD